MIPLIWKVRLALVAVVLTLCVIGVRQFVAQQRAIGALSVTLAQERARRDALTVALVAQQDTLRTTRQHAADAADAAARAMRHAVVARGRFDSVSRAVDTLRSDSSVVAVTVVRDLQLAAHAAVVSCQVAVDSLVVVRDTLTVLCDRESKRADIAVKIGESLRGELLITRQRSVVTAHASYSAGLKMGVASTALVMILVTLAR